MLISWPTISLDFVVIQERNYLQSLVEKHNSFIELFLFNYQLCSMYLGCPTYHVGDDSGQQKVLLMLVRALL
jgi:hypothetical protein